MKTNTMMRVASVLLVAVLLSTCAISGTFAKYVTTDSGSDSARVAKWGVTITPNGTLFEKQYAKNDNTYTVGDNTVASNDTWNVIAPGTTANLTEVELTGTPEVATRVTYVATVNLDGWVLTDGTTEYCPVYFTIEGKTYGTADAGVELDNTCANVNALKTAIAEAIAGCNKDYAPNTNLASVANDYPTVTWTWAFHTSDANDAKDTDLGNKAAAGNYAVVQIIIATTVTQID